MELKTLLNRLQPIQHGPVNTLTELQNDLLNQVSGGGCTHGDDWGKCTWTKALWSQESAENY